jgi:hypothetical protein
LKGETNETQKLLLHTATVLTLAGFVSNSVGAENENDPSKKTANKTAEAKKG